MENLGCFQVNKMPWWVTKRNLARVIMPLIQCSKSNQKEWESWNYSKSRSLHHPLLSWGFLLGRLPDIFYPSGTKLIVEASGAVRPDRQAGLLPKPHQQPVDLCPLGLGQPSFQGLPGFLRGLSLGPAQSVADPVNVGVHSDPALFFPSDVHANVGHFWTDPGQFAQPFHIVWDVAVIFSL